jgi:hypothetical protein
VTGHPSVAPTNTELPIFGVFFSHCGIDRRAEIRERELGDRPLACWAVAPNSFSSRKIVTAAKPALLNITPDLIEVFDSFFELSGRLSKWQNWRRSCVPQILLWLNENSPVRPSRAGGRLLQCVFTTRNVSEARKGNLGMSSRRRHASNGLRSRTQNSCANWVRLFGVSTMLACDLLIECVFTTRNVSEGSKLPRFQQQSPGSDEINSLLAMVMKPQRTRWLGSCGKQMSDPNCAKHPKGRFPAIGG